MEPSGTFSHLGGTFSHLGGTELVTFVKIGTCNGTSYNFVPLERNLTSYIWNGTFITTAFQYHAQGNPKNQNILEEIDNSLG